MLGIKKMGKTFASSAGSSSKFTTGTYTGDGNATQAIAGLGFAPTIVMVIALVQDVNASNFQTWKTMSMQTSVTPTNAIALYRALNTMNTDDFIPSLDADGFTVGDGSTFTNVLNLNGKTYYYAAWA